MATMSISLPDEIKAFVEGEAAKRGFGTVSEYIRAIIHEQQKRQPETTRLDALLIEGLESGPSTPLTQEDWNHVKREGRRQISDRKHRRK
jgi:antitoxin ParD1/3/4